MADEHARRVVDAGAARAADHGVGRDAGPVLHRLHLPSFVHSAALSCVLGMSK